MLVKEPTRPELPQDLYMKISALLVCISGLDTQEQTSHWVPVDLETSQSPLFIGYLSGI